MRLNQPAAESLPEAGCGYGESLRFEPQIPLFAGLSRATCILKLDANVAVLSCFPLVVFPCPRTFAGIRRSFEDWGLARGMGAVAHCHALAGKMGYICTFITPVLDHWMGQLM